MHSNSVYHLCIMVMWGVGVQCGFSKLDFLSSHCFSFYYLQTVYMVKQDRLCCTICIILLGVLNVNFKLTICECYRRKNVEKCYGRVMGPLMNAKMHDMNIFSARIDYCLVIFNKLDRFQYFF